MFVCVKESARERGCERGSECVREGERGTERDSERERVRVREGESDCVSHSRRVCVCVREREGECVCEREIVYHTVDLRANNNFICVLLMKEKRPTTKKHTKRDLLKRPTKSRTVCQR